ncbi:hypothetical protein EZV62_008816 [Acer yangbiense]|uniref:KIB1-4 beta-propeller domain-containing protein n=1 Tax=Acer yangbiense TaxID=1000413 RepID=A0A5C7IEG4_9ROSI|nr:hypothetical protein EZV62_008816 [Acer yangbiense]
MRTSLCFVEIYCDHYLTSVSIALKCALAFCRPGDKSWTFFEGVPHLLDDVTFYKGEFYAVNSVGYFFHLHCHTPATQKVLCPWPRIDFLQLGKHNYLVELDGKLLLAVRYGHEYWGSHFTSVIEIYEWNWVEKVWIKVKNIGNNAILLGAGSSISLPISHFRNFKANCIYVIGDCIAGFLLKISERVNDTGFYNMTTGQFEYLYESSLIWSSPLNWFIPPSPVIYKRSRAEVICREKKGKMKSWSSKIRRSLLNWLTALLLNTLQDMVELGGNMEYWNV